MAGRVTIQDIADALGLSRNTVSKAINDTGTLAPSTREKVLKKAVEMGYKQFSYMNTPNFNSNLTTSVTQKAGGEIALLTCAKLDYSHFSATMLDKFQKEISQLGYSLTMHRVTSNDIKKLRLPNSFRRESTDGIMCIEMFNYEYSQMVTSLNIPTLFVDSPVLDGRPLNSDRLSMDNRTEIFAFVREMKKRGKTKIAFVGKCDHCESFFERYIAYREAMYLNKLDIPEEACIVDGPSTQEDAVVDSYRSYILRRLDNLKEMPEVFICANDFVAIDIIQAFRQLNISVPDDVMICGFDDSPESRILTPPLTTIHIHCEILGLSAVQMLFSRIKEPSLNYRTIYTETNLVYRQSTND